MTCRASQAVARGAGAYRGAMRLAAQRHARSSATASWAVARSPDAKGIDDGEQPMELWGLHGRRRRQRMERTHSAPSQGSVWKWDDDGGRRPR